MMEMAPGGQRGLGKQGFPDGADSKPLNGAGVAWARTQPAARLSLGLTFQTTLPCLPSPAAPALFNPPPPPQSLPLPAPLAPAGLIIDARSKGNLARLLNSSCDPNCETQKWHDAGNGEVGAGAEQARQPVGLDAGVASAKQAAHPMRGLPLVRFTLLAWSCIPGMPHRHVPGSALRCRPAWESTRCATSCPARS